MNNAQRAFLALVLLVGLTVAARAQYVGGGSIGASGGGGGSGAASFLQDTVDGIVDVLDTAGVSRGQFVTRASNSEFYVQEDGGGGIIKLTTGGLALGQTGSPSALSGLVSFASLINTSTGTVATPVFTVYGGGGVVHGPGTALAISGTPDTTRDPVLAGTACRFSAASPGQTWTWPESSGVTGTIICCTNTGANSVVVNDSAGVFEGTGPTVGQWDTICAEYVTDRWVQRSFMDN